MKQDISNFEISMHCIDFMKTSEPVNNLLQENTGFILSESLFFLKVALQITTIAKLHRNKLSFFSTKSVNVANHILVITLLQYSNLSGYKFFEFRRVDHESSGNGLDSNSTIGILIKGLIDVSPGSLTQFPNERERFHFLSEYVLMLHI